ncbi:hypothetical protein ACRAWF_29865 [Streptomyces sp. L7]
MPRPSPTARLPGPPTDPQLTARANCARPIPADDLAVAELGVVDPHAVLTRRLSPRAAADSDRRVRHRDRTGTPQWSQDARSVIFLLGSGTSVRWWPYSVSSFAFLREGGSYDRTASTAARPRYCRGRHRPTSSDGVYALPEPVEVILLIRSAELRIHQLAANFADPLATPSRILGTRSGPDVFPQACGDEIISLQGLVLSSTPQAAAAGGPPGRSRRCEVPGLDEELRPSSRVAPSRSPGVEADEQLAVISTVARMARPLSAAGEAMEHVAVVLAR